MRVAEEAAHIIRRALGVKASLPEDLELELQPAPLVTERKLSRGGYDPYQRTIVLTGDLWCWKTLIHETLHSMSTFLRDEELIPRCWSGDRW